MGRLRATMGAARRRARQRVSAAPGLSVVVPVRDGADHLDACLDSVLRQRVDLEVLVVDDASTDGTRRLAAERARRDPRVRVLTGDGRGPGAARNLGVRAARGRHLTFADADDQVLPDAYPRMLATLTRTGSDFVTGGYLRTGAAGTHRPRVVDRLHVDDLDRTTVARSPQILTEPVLWNKVFVRAFWDRAVGEAPEQGNYEDQEPAVRAAVRATSFDVLAQDVYLWRLPDGRRTRSQHKDQVQDLADRRRVLAALTGLVDGQPSGVRAVAYATWLGADLEMFAQHVPTTGPEYWSELCRLARDLAVRAPDGAWDLMPVQQRVLTAVVLSGDRDDLEHLLGVRAERGTAVPVRLGADGPRLRLPGLDGLRCELPRSVTRPRAADLDLQARVRSVRWTPCGAELTGYAYVRGVDTSEAPATVTVLQPDGVELRTDPVDDAHVDLEAGDPTTAHRHEGFRVVVPAAGAAAGPMTLRWSWQDRQREVPLRSAPGHPPLWLGPVDGAGRQTVVAVDHRDRLSLRTSDRHPVRAAAVTVTDGRVVVDLEPRGSAVTGVTLAQGSVIRPAAPVPGDPNRWTAELPAVPPSMDVVGEHRWAVRATLATVGTGPVGCLTTVDLDLPGAARPEIDDRGDLVIAQRGRRVRAEQLRLEPGVLVVHGTAHPAPVDLALVSSHACREPAQVKWHHHRFEARFDRTAVSPDGTRVAIERDGYFLRWRPPGTQDYQGWVRAGGTLRTEPVELASRWCSVSVTPRRDGAVPVQVSAPLSVAERTKVGQTRLRARRWGPVRAAVLFESFNGTSTTDNPGGVHALLRRAGVDVPMLWSVVDLSVPVPAGTEPVVLGSERWHEAVATSRLLVTNNNFPWYFRKCPGQYLLQTWHGTPIKRLLFDLRPDQVALTYRRVMREQAPQWDLLLAQTQSAAQDLRTGLGYGGPTMLVENPRNLRLVDGLCDPGPVRDRLGLAEGERVVLYAPTWREAQRGGAPMQWSDLVHLPALVDVVRSAGARLLVRRHHVSAGREVDLPGVLDVTGEPWIEDLLAVADVLVTDYSSCVHDFALTGRPVVHHVPDLAEYRRERGFYRRWPAGSPWPVVRTQAALHDEVRAGLDRRADPGQALDQAAFDSSVDPLVRHLCEVLAGRTSSSVPFTAGATA